MSRPRLIVCAGPDLFGSFFTAAQKRRLSHLFEWKRDGAQALSGLKNLARAQGLITTWDSPQFSEELVRLAPDLRIIAHCGGEVKRRFARPLFESLTITTGPVPMARATAEMGATLLLYCARNVDFYREQLRGRSNRIYQDLHLHGSSESIIGQEVAMPAELQSLAAQVTDSNAAIFDPAHHFHGCIPGIHEILRRQGLIEGRWCLDPKEELSPGQMEEIDRVCKAYPHLQDDAFVKEHLDDWLR